MEIPFESASKINKKIEIRIWFKAFRDMFEPTYDKYSEDLTHFPIKYESHSILSRLEEGREARLKVTKEAFGGQEGSVNTSWSRDEANLGIGASYKTMIKNTLFEFRSNPKNISVFADFGTSFHAQKRVGCDYVRTSVLQSFLGVEIDKKTPHSKFMSTFGLLVHNRCTKFGLLIRGNHGLCDELPRGVSTELKLSKNCQRTGATIDLTARYNPNQNIPAENVPEGTCPYNNWSISNPFNLQLPQLSLLISRSYKDVLFQVGANREAGNGCPFIAQYGHLTITYDPKPQVTLVSRIGLDFTQESKVPSVRVGARHQCCDRFQWLANLDSDGKLGFGLKSVGLFKGLKMGLKGLVDLPSIKKNGLTIIPPPEGCTLSLKVGVEL